jgi:hypothetical protein
MLSVTCPMLCLIVLDFDSICVSCLLFREVGFEFYICFSDVDFASFFWVFVLIEFCL